MDNHANSIFPNRSWSNISRLRLNALHPRLRSVLEASLFYTPYDMAVTCTLRRRDVQAKLVEQGLSRTMNSKHLMQRTGYPEAIDIMCIDPSTGRGTWENHAYIANSIVIKAIASSMGVDIRWGGNFTSFFDGPHFELVNK